MDGLQMRSVVTDDVETCMIIGVAVSAGRDPARFLGRDEQIRRHQLPVSHQPQWLAGRIALKLAYRAFLGRQVPLVAVRTWNDRLGRPRVGESRRWWHCSVSHIDGWALAAVSPAPVGVDIEAVRDLDPRAIRLVATPHERSLIERWTPSRAAALRLWTVKEAVLKGLGTGFRTDPRSVRVVEADSHTARVDAVEGPDTPGGRWRVSSEILEDRVVSIAHVGSHICSARIRWIDRAGVSAALDTP